MTAGGLPELARRWVREVCGDAPEGVTRLDGATTAAVDAISVGGRRLVLKRFVNPAFVAEDPGRAEQEAALLELLAPTPVPAPELVAVDPDGSRAGCPTVLMSRRPGTRRVPNPSPEASAWVLAVIHQVDPAVPYRFRRYQDGVAEVRPPPWTSRPGLWRQAIERAAGPGPRSAAGLIHRDANDGNLLWVGDDVTGVVDWLSGCRGPLGIDLARIRLDLALRGEQAAADGVLAEYHRVGTPGAYHPHWDVVDAVDVLPYYEGMAAVARWPGSGPWDRDRLEVFLAAALGELG